MVHGGCTEGTQARNNIVQRKRMTGAAAGL
jgi:hypothetical protein